MPDESCGWWNLAEQIKSALTRCLVSVEAWDKHWVFNLLVHTEVKSSGVEVSLEMIRAALVTETVDESKTISLRVW